MSNNELLAEARSLQDWLSGLRRTLHMMPELSLREYKTSAHLADELGRLGLKPSKLWGEGLVADIDAPKGAGRIALRADMDALPIQELNEIPFRSRHDGVAHMCGHDTHMAILLGTAKMLAGKRERLRHSVRLIFQPAEETPPGGARGLIQNGALEGVDEVYALHNQPALEVGKVSTCAGPLTAAADTISMRLTGRGGHASRPHESLDPIPAACALVGQLQTLVARRVSPAQQAVVSITRIQSGTTHNIIPDHADLLGTVRTFDAPVRDLLEREIGAMVAGVAAAHGLEHEYRFERGYDSIVNHESGVRRVAEAAGSVVGAENVNTKQEPATWGEDFSYFLQQRPGAFFLLGSGNRREGICEPLHSARFNVDERCLPLGVAILATLALS